MQSSFAYNVPESMKLNDTVTIELLLNPSVSASELGNQVTESGTLTTGTFEITPRMKAELIRRMQMLSLSPKSQKTPFN